MPNSHSPTVPPCFWPSYLKSLPATQALCLTVALVLGLLGTPWWYAVLYSLLIGNLCALFINLGLRGISLARARHGKTVQNGGWPNTLTTGLVVVLSVLAGMLIGTRLGDLLMGHHTAWPSPGLHTWALVFAMSLLPSVVGTWLFRSRARLAAAQAEAEQALRHATEAKLRLLESQLEPHMLFNTLANLRALIGLDPPQAQLMLDKLIDYLRATLNASRSESHAVSLEFARLQDYLALMQIRMGQRLKVEFAMAPEAATLPMPPLLLQPLVENAIKHGLEPHRPGGLLRVTAQRAGQVLCLRVEDSGAGLSATPSPQAGTGFGLTQIRERLQTLHGAAAHLSLQPREGGGTVAQIDLPITPSP
ncbi:MAG: sensor histidine kinase [Ideonella sp. MAG2]|nr:MAG: sensor histidine kinase [Ideonella sp. MAG2]